MLMAVSSAAESAIAANTKALTYDGTTQFLTEDIKADENQKQS